MSSSYNTIICNLYSFADHSCRRFSKQKKDLEKLQECYFRYRDMAEEQERLRSKIMILFGTLGVHFPQLSPELGVAISPEQTKSSDFRKEQLKLWQVLELFLFGLQRRGTYAEFSHFVYVLGIEEISTTQQAVDSAVRAHPELFAEEHEGRSKYYVLRASEATR